MERISKSNVKRKDHPLTMRERYDFLVSKNKNLEILSKHFDLDLESK